MVSCTKRVGQLNKMNIIKSNDLQLASLNLQHTDTKYRLLVELKMFHLLWRNDVADSHAKLMLELLFFHLLWKSGL